MKPKGKSGYTNRTLSVSLMVSRIESLIRLRTASHSRTPRASPRVLYTHHSTPVDSNNHMEAFRL